MAINVEGAGTHQATASKVGWEISLPLIGDVQAAGRTPSQFEQDITDRLKAYVTNPQVAVIVLEIKSENSNILEPNAAQAIVDGHTRKGLNNTTAIHKLLTLELIQRACSLMRNNSVAMMTFETHAE